MQHCDRDMRRHPPLSWMRSSRSTEVTENSLYPFLVPTANDLRQEICTESEHKSHIPITRLTQLFNSHKKCGRTSGGRFQVAGNCFHVTYSAMGVVVQWVTLKLHNSRLGVSNLTSVLWICGYVGSHSPKVNLCIFHPERDWHPIQGVPPALCAVLPEISSRWPWPE